MTFRLGRCFFLLPSETPLPHLAKDQTFYGFFFFITLPSYKSNTLECEGGVGLIQIWPPCALAFKGQPHCAPSVFASLGMSRFFMSNSEKRIKVWGLYFISLSHHVQRILATKPMQFLSCRIFPMKNVVTSKHWHSSLNGSKRLGLDEFSSKCCSFLERARSVHFIRSTLPRSRSRGHKSHQA